MQLEAFRRNTINEFDIQYLQNNLANTPDDSVRKTALELLVDRYTLSRIYSKQGNIESEQDLLPILVPRAIYELRNAILSDIINDLTQQLASLTTGQSDMATELLKQISEHKALQQKLAGVLGERIILPKNS